MNENHETFSSNQEEYGKYYHNSVNDVFTIARIRIPIALKIGKSLDEAIEWSIGESSLTSPDVYNSKDRELVKEATRLIKEKGIENI